MRIRVSRGMVVLLLGVAVLGVVRAGQEEDYRALWDRVWPWLIVALAAGIHEGGHLIAAWGAGVGIKGMRFDLFGARMELRGLLSYGQELMVAVGGPLASFLSAAVAYPFRALQGGAGVSLFFGASLILGGVNLLPVSTLDGGRILGCAIARLIGEGAARIALQVTTGFCLGLLWLLAVYALLRDGQMLSLFVFSFCLLVRSATGERGRDIVEQNLSYG